MRLELEHAGLLRRNLSPLVDQLDAQVGERVLLGGDGGGDVRELLQGGDLQLLRGDLTVEGLHLGQQGPDLVLEALDRELLRRDLAVELSQLTVQGGDLPGERGGRPLWPQ